MNKAPLFRTRAQAANSNRRIALDLRLADRLERQGIRAYRSVAVESDVDLATFGGLSEVRGRPLINCVLFGSQSIRQVAAIRRELVAFEERHGQSDNIDFITIRPRRDLCEPDGGEILLDERGRTPIKNLRRIHRLTNEAIQGALEYMASREWLTPLSIGRHWDPIDGGAFLDWHAHVTIEIDPKSLKKISTYLRSHFGADRIWISSEEEPNKRRTLVGTACYPAAKAANRGFEDVADDFLEEFFRQSAGLRRIELAGPLRAERKAQRRTAPATVTEGSGPDAELNSIEADVNEMIDAMAADEAVLSGATNVDDDIGATQDISDAACADTAPGRTDDPAAREVADAPHVIGCHFAYIGLSLRWVVRVANYRGWNDLIARYDLTADITHAQRLAARAEHILFLDPATPESSNTDEPLDLESLIDWEPLRAVDVETTGRQTAEPRAVDVETTGRQTAEPEKLRRPSIPESARAGTENDEYSEVQNADLAGLTLELTVRSEHGPATATLRVGAPMSRLRKERARQTMPSRPARIAG